MSKQLDSIKYNETFSVSQVKLKFRNKPKKLMKMRLEFKISMTVGVMKK